MDGNKMGWVAGRPGRLQELGEGSRLGPRDSEIEMSVK